MEPPLVPSLFQPPSTCKTLLTDRMGTADQPYSQIEYMILALMLKYSGLQALVIAYIGGTVLFSIQLFVSDRQYSS